MLYAFKAKFEISEKFWVHCGIVLNFDGNIYPWWKPEGLQLEFFYIVYRKKKFFFQKFFRSLFDVSSLEMVLVEYFSCFFPEIQLSFPTAIHSNLLLLWCISKPRARKWNGNIISIWKTFHLEKCSTFSPISISVFLHTVEKLEQNLSLSLTHICQKKLRSTVEFDLE